MRIASRVDSAETLMGRLDGSPTVAGIVPSGFERYVRVLSPLRVRSGGEPDALELQVPWSLICEQLGVELTPDILWRRNIVSADARIADFGEPGLGLYNADVVERIGEILQRYETEDRFWCFATWVGYGAAEGNQPVWFTSHYHDALEMIVFERWNEAAAPFATPLVPSRAESATPLSTFGREAPSEWEPPAQLPMYWWPAGHDWVLGQALYGRSVYLACNDAIADEILAAKGLEAIEVSLSDGAEYEE